MLKNRINHFFSMNCLFGEIRLVKSDNPIHFNISFVFARRSTLDTQ